MVSKKDVNFFFEPLNGLKMKKTIQAIEAILKEKEKLSAQAQFQIKGGESGSGNSGSNGCEDKRREL